MAVKARCGNTEPHGAHTETASRGYTGYRWCAGNQNVIIGHPVCVACGEGPALRADGSPRIPYQHRYGPTTHDYIA